MIPATHWADGEDGMAWWVVSSPVDAQVALDRTCDTCGGDGAVDVPEDDEHFNQTAPCSDCDGTGRHTFDVDVDADYFIEPSHHHVTAEVHRVSVVPGMVLPIFDHDELLDGVVSLPRDWAPHIDVIEEVPHLCSRSKKYPDDWDEEPITLPPAAKPGVWAIQLRKADR